MNAGVSVEVGVDEQDDGDGQEGEGEGGGQEGWGQHAQDGAVPGVQVLAAVPPEEGQEPGQQG